MNKYVFKICTLEEWKKALKKGIYQGSNMDKKDGFIHLSTKPQVKDTLKMYFKNINNLCLLKIHTKDLEILFEKSRNAEYFPHLYNTFKTTCVHKVYPLKLKNDGSHVLPNFNTINKC